MNDQSRVLTGALLGAVAGGAAAYLVATDRGRRLLRQVGPALDDVTRALAELDVIIRKLDGVVQEARVVIADVRNAPSERGSGDLAEPLRA